MLKWPSLFLPPINLYNVPKMIYNDANKRYVPSYQDVLSQDGKYSANDKQEGGNHYKQYGNIQPWDVVLAWKLGYLEGTALKYIARHKDKNGVEDIKKAIHFLEKLVEEYNNIYGENK